MNGSEVTIRLKVSHARVLAELVRDTSDFEALKAEISLVDFDLILERVVTDTATSINYLLHDSLNLLAMVIETEHEVAGDGSVLVRGQVLVIELRDLVEISQLAEGAEEVIGGDGGLAFEECEPENLGTLSLEDVANFGGQIIVHDVLKVNLVQVVGPWVEHGEALVLYALSTILHNVGLEEFEVSFVGVDWVLQIFGDDGLFLVANKRADSLNARA